MLCILTDEWVLQRPFTGQNHYFWGFNIFSRNKREKQEKIQKEIFLPPCLSFTSHSILSVLNFTFLLFLVTFTLASQKTFLLLHISQINSPISPLSLSLSLSLLLFYFPFYRPFLHTPIDSSEINCMRMMLWIWPQLIEKKNLIMSV